MFLGTGKRRIFYFFIFCMLPVAFRIPGKVALTAVSFGKEIVREKLSGQVKAASFLQLEWEQGTVYYTEADKEYAPMVAEMLSVYTPLLEGDLEVELSSRVQAIVYPDKKSLAKALGVLERNAPMGAYYAGTLYILSPASWAADSEDWQKIDRFLEEGPVVHELVHLMVDEKLSGQYDIWFTEGVALYFEKKYTGFEWRPELSEEAKKISYADLQAHFSDLNEGAAYRKSYELIAEAVAQTGTDGLLLVMEKMAEGVPFLESYEKVLETKKAERDERAVSENTRTV